MAGRVQSIRIFASLAHPAGLVPEALFYRFAKLEGGPVVFTDAHESIKLTICSLSLTDLEALLGTHLGWRSTVPPEARAQHWGPLLDRLERWGVETDAETLLSLSFELVPDRALRRFFERRKGADI